MTAPRGSWRVVRHRTGKPPGCAAHHSGAAARLDNQRTPIVCFYQSTVDDVFCFMRVHVTVNPGRGVSGQRVIIVTVSPEVFLLTRRTTPIAVGVFNTCLNCDGPYKRVAKNYLAVLFLEKANNLPFRAAHLERNIFLPQPTYFWRTEQTWHW